MTPQQRARLIAQYKEGYRQVADALKDISNPELDFRPNPEKWTAREVVQHLADSETISGYRLRRLLVEHSPYIQGYDQDEFAKKLRYGSRAMEPALRAFEAARETTGQLLDLMTEEEWRKSGEHSDSGPYSAETWLEIYAAHAHNHANQIRRNRAAYKKEQE